MDRCDAYWKWLGQPKSEKPSGADAKSRYGEYVAAINEMATRGPDIVNWAADRLTHAETDAAASRLPFCWVKSPASML